MHNVNNKYAVEGRFKVGPNPELELVIQAPDRPGSIRNFAANCETINSAIQFSLLNYTLKADGSTGVLKATLGGVGLATLREVMNLAKTPRILAAPGAAAGSQLVLSGPALPAHGQWKLFIETQAYDRAGLALEFTTPIHGNSGTLLWYRGETLNSGRSPGTADFIQLAVAGFATRREAIECERQFNTQSEFHSVKIVRLFLDDMHPVSVPIAA